MKLTELSNKTIRQEIFEQINNDQSIFDNEYRLLSERFMEFINEARKMFAEGLLTELDQFDQEILESDLGEFAIVDGVEVPLDLPILDEAEKKGRKVALNKPMRSSGPKKFKVYVKNPKTGNIKVVNFGAQSGGQSLAVKINDPQARKNFAARHKCSERKDKTTASYWACRLPRYAKQLGLSGGGSYWW